uniref:Uncharacterized protein n=1 Tax=Arundo donax TaxID=35708 RepID=A0A0A8XV06_ARUDO
MWGCGYTCQLTSICFGSKPGSGLPGHPSIDAAGFPTQYSCSNAADASME